MSGGLYRLSVLILLLSFIAHAEGETRPPNDPGPLTPADVGNLILGGAVPVMAPLGLSPRLGQQLPGQPNPGTQPAVVPETPVAPTRTDTPVPVPVAQDPPTNPPTTPEEITRVTPPEPPIPTPSEIPAPSPNESLFPSSPEDPLAGGPRNETPVQRLQESRTVKSPQDPALKKLDNKISGFTNAGRIREMSEDRERELIESNHDEKKPAVANPEEAVADGYGVLDVRSEAESRPTKDLPRVVTATAPISAGPVSESPVASSSVATATEPSGAQSAGSPSVEERLLRLKGIRSPDVEDVRAQAGRLAEMISVGVASGKKPTASERLLSSLALIDEKTLQGETAASAKTKKGRLASLFISAGRGLRRLLGLSDSEDRTTHGERFKRPTQLAALFPSHWRKEGKVIPSWLGEEEEAFLAGLGFVVGTLISSSGFFFLVWARRKKKERSKKNRDAQPSFERLV